MKPELVVSTMTREQALSITKRIRQQLVDLFDTIVEAYSGRVWLALDYGTWEDYVKGENLKTSDERTIVRLVDESELSSAAVAAIGGVSQQAISKRRGRQGTTRLLPGAKTLGRDGKRQPSSRPKPHEIERRRDIVEQLWADRYGRTPIAVALDVGNGTVDGDLLARHVDKTARRGPLRTVKLPSHIAWRDGEEGSKPPRPIKPKPPKPPPDISDVLSMIDERHERRRWREQSTVGRLQLLHEAYDDEGLALQLATSFDDALLSDSADAQLWLVETQTLLLAVAREVQTLLAISLDSAYREQVMRAARASEVPAPPPVSL